MLGSCRKSRVTFLLRPADQQPALRSDVVTGSRHQAVVSISGHSHHVGGGGREERRSDYRVLERDRERQGRQSTPACDEGVSSFFCRRDVVIRVQIEQDVKARC